MKATIRGKSGYWKPCKCSNQTITLFGLFPVIRLWTETGKYEVKKERLLVSQLKNKKT